MMNRVIRLLAIIAGTLIVALVVTLIAARLYFTDDRILAKVRPKLEENLNRTLDIDHAKLSFWGGLGVRLEGVTLGNAPGFTEPYLLQLRELDVKVRFWPLLSGDVILDRVLIGPGELRLEIDGKGNNNWTNIAKVDTTAVPITPADSAIAALPQIPVAGNMEFTSISIRLDDRQGNKRIDVSKLDGRLELGMNEADSTINAWGAFHIDDGTIRTADHSWSLAEARPDIEFKVRADPLKKQIDLQSLNLTAFGIPMESSGRVQYRGDSTKYALDVAVKDVELVSIFGQLPDSLWRPSFPGGPPKGLLQAEIMVSSPPAGAPYPLLEGKILLSGVEGKFGEKNLPFNVAGADIRLAKTVASLTAQSLNFAGIPLNLNLTVDNPAAPNFSGGVSGEIEMTRLAELMDAETAAKPGGRVRFNLSAFGALENWRGLKLNGDLSLENVVWRTADTLVMDIDNLSGKIEFTGSGAKIAGLNLRSGRSQLKIDGQMDKLIPYLTHLGREVEKPHFQFTILSPFTDLDEMFPAEDAAAGSGTMQAETPAIPMIDMIADGTIRVDTAIYFDVPFTAFTCQAHFEDFVLTLSEAQGRAYGGSLTGKATVDYTDWNKPAFVIESKADDIEINDFLTDFTGFGGHVYGKFDLTGTFAGKGEEVVDIVQSLTAKGNGLMTDGRFAGISVISALAGQAGLKGITDSGPIKDLAGNFWIEQGRLFTDNLNFSSAGTKYGLAGSVGFDGSLDYHIQVDLPKGKGGNDVLSTLGNLLSGDQGGVTLNLKLGGTYSQPLIQLDSKQNQEAFKRNLQSKARGLLDKLR